MMRFLLTSKAVNSSLFFPNSLNLYELTLSSLYLVMRVVCLYLNSEFFTSKKCTFEKVASYKIPVFFHFSLLRAKNKNFHWN